MESMILAVSLLSSMGSPTPLQAAEQARAAASRESYIKVVHAAADILGVKIDALEAKSAKAAGEARVKFDDKIRGLNVRRKTLKKGLVRLARAGAEAWTKAKADVDRDIDELEEAYDEAVADTVARDR